MIQLYWACLTPLFYIHCHTGVFTHKAFMHSNQTSAAVNSPTLTVRLSSTPLSATPLTINDSVIYWSHEHLFPFSSACVSLVFCCHLWRMVFHSRRGRDSPHSLCHCRCNKSSVSKQPMRVIMGGVRDNGALGTDMQTAPPTLILKSETHSVR